MTVNRLSLFALSASIGFHVAILSVAGGYFANFSKQTTKLEIQAIEPQLEKNSYLPEIKVIGEFKKLTSSEEFSAQKPGMPKEKSAFEAVYDEPEHIAESIDKQQEAMLRYQDAVKQRIESCRRYPAWAQKQKIEGAVDLQFTIAANGDSQNITIVQGSGSSLLDEEARDTIKRASPFRPLPKEINQGTVNIHVAIVFSMR